MQLPGALRSARVSPPWRAVIGAAVVVVLAISVMTWRILSASALSEPVATGYTPTPGRTPAAGASQEPAAIVSSPAAAPGEASAVSTPLTAQARPHLVIHVIGKVARPGVVNVPDGSRVQDVVTAAGGPVKGADLTAVNLARRAIDGEQLVIPQVGEVPPPAPPGAPGVPASGAAPAGSGGAPAGTGGATPGAVIDLNTADQATLETLPGVGPVLAARILQWRAEHGRFSSVEELAEVSGVGEKRYAELAPRVRV